MAASCAMDYDDCWVKAGRFWKEACRISGLSVVEWGEQHGYAVVPVQIQELALSAEDEAKAFPYHE